MNKFLLPLLAFSFLLVTSNVNAQGQQRQLQCNERSQVVSHLSNKYKELPIGAGPTTTGGMLELFNAADGDWTIIVSMPAPNGKVWSCLVAAGEGWRKLTPNFDTLNEDSGA